MKKGCIKKKEKEGQDRPLGAKWCVDGGEGRVRKQGVAICLFPWCCKASPKSLKNLENCMEHVGGAAM